jgi:Lon protease-like protein
MPQRPASPLEVPDVVPIFPLTGALLLPYSHRPLNIFEPRYLAMVDFALSTDRLIGLIQPEDTIEESGDGRYFIILEGVARFELGEEVERGTPYRLAKISTGAFAADFTRNDGEEAVDRARFVKMMRDYAEFASIDLNWEEIERTGTADLVNFCAMVSPYGPAEKQVLLEARTLNDRAETLIAMTEYEMAGGGKGAVPLN